MTKLLSRCRQRPILFIIVSVLIVGALVAGITATAIGSDSKESSLFPSCTPETNPERIAEYQQIMDDFQQKTGATTNDEEQLALRDEMKKLLVEKGFLKPVTGPEANGSGVTIARKTIQLPPDAYVFGIATIDAGIVPGQSEEEARRAYDNRSAWDIRRGNSCVFVGVVTGDVLWGEISPGDERAFDFLKEAFPGQSAAIDALPILPLSNTSLVEVMK